MAVYNARMPVSAERYLAERTCWHLASSMIRRNILILIGLLGLGFIAILSVESWFIRKIYHKIEDLFIPPVRLPPESERENKILANGGYAIQVETALNSRCTSDYDGNQNKFHWGMFDQTKRLTDEQIKNIVHLANVPHFTDERVEIRIEKNILSFVIDNQKQGLIREHMMVESGMQQQAVGLVCAALGVGLLFVNSGKDGRRLSETVHENVKIELDAMKPSYNESYWTSMPPNGNKSWRNNNLPDPLRTGTKPLLSVLEELKAENSNGKIATKQAMSQLLWAARGRTPHLYKSRPWGMTIPTSRGEQNITGVYVILEGKLSRYVNWRWKGWAHSTELVKAVSEELGIQLLNWLPSYNCLIVLAKNEHFAEADWEIGYQSLNLMLQAKSLNLSYRLVLLNEKDREFLHTIGIKGAVASLFTTYG